MRKSRKLRELQAQGNYTKTHNNQFAKITVKENIPKAARNKYTLHTEEDM